MASLVYTKTPSLSSSSSLSSTTPFLRSSIFFLRPKSSSSSRLPAVRAKIREIFMPALSSTMTEGKIVSWIKSEGDTLSKGESVVVVESDKADMDVETFYDGILAAIVVNEGETAPVGSPIGLLAETEDEIAEAKAKAAAQSTGAPTSSAPKFEDSAPVPIAAPAPAPAQALASAPTAPGKVVATPYAKKLAKQHKVDIDKIVGTGSFGRITPEDVEKAAGITITPKSNVSVPAAAAPATPPKAAASFPEIPGSSVVPFTTMQAAVSKNMVESLSVPTFRVGYPVGTDALDALYEKLDLYLLSQKWKELVEKARAKQLQPHEYNSGTFTLSNLGMFGVDRFDAILPPGQGAIMAVGASKPTVSADKDGFFSVKNKMLVNVTADHRIIYGADLAAFLKTFSKIVENPESLTM